MPGCCGSTPNHQLLISECYPHGKALVESKNNDYQPISNGLGKLSYYCTLKSHKLTKVTDALAAKAKKDARSAAKSPAQKASLCITLAITKRLIHDCKHCLNFFAAQALDIVRDALSVTDSSGAAAGYSSSGGSWDLDVAERAAGVFVAWITFAEGSTLELDSNLSKSATRSRVGNNADELDRNYMAVLEAFSNMAQQPYEQNAANAYRYAESPRGYAATYVLRVVFA